MFVVAQGSDIDLVFGILFAIWASRVEPHLAVMLTTPTGILGSPISPASLWKLSVGINTSFFALMYCEMNKKGNFSESWMLSTPGSVSAKRAYCLSTASSETRFVSHDIVWVHVFAMLEQEVLYSRALCHGLVRPPQNFDNVCRTGVVAESQKSLFRLSAGDGESDRWFEYRFYTPDQDQDGLKEPVLDEVVHDDSFFTWYVFAFHKLIKALRIEIRDKTVS